MVDRVEAAKARQRWMHFAVAAPEQYAKGQVEALVRHMAATPALDLVSAAPHDADGRPTYVINLSMEHIR